MITNLTFNIEFSPTEKYPSGRIIKGSHNFEKGLSAITGKNEAGKSLRIEMIRYALFGSQALRASASSYGNIEVELDFVISGADYKVKRKGSKVTLTKNSEQIATGVKPVNQAIERILGYDIQVFDIANACLQGEIEAMTNMRPTERKAMVDKTIGLNAVDSVIKEVSDELNSTKKAIEMLNEKVVVVNVKPEQPNVDLSFSAKQLEQILFELREKVNEKKFIEGQLAALIEPKVPDKKPQEDIYTETLEELKSQLHNLDVDFASLESIKSLISKYKSIHNGFVNYTPEQIKTYIDNKYAEQWVKYHSYERQRVEPVNYTECDLEFLQLGFDAHKDLNGKIPVSCPECFYNFVVKKDGNLHEDNFDWEKFESLKESLNIKKQSDIIVKGQELLEYNKFLNLEVVQKPLVDEIPNIQKLETLLNLLNEFGDFDIEAETKMVSDKEENYKSTRASIVDKISFKEKCISEKKAYEEALKLLKEYQTKLVEINLAINRIGPVEEVLVLREEQYIVIRNYEQALKEYELKQEAQSQALETLATLEANLKELTNVKKSLTEIKPKVKTHLLPSLNRVASTLLSQMTNNDRNSIVIDEDFDITVDGQAVNTLSGSGKAIANLAVRIGLGTVLTNKVFSVFLADEIDASMDSERAAYTAECLQNLTSIISQIILVSHQQPDADHQIEV